MTDPSEFIPWLGRTYLFAALNEQQLKTVMETMQEVNIEEGRMLFEHGQPADRFYLLLEGQIKLYRLSEDGDEKVIEIVRPGETFAEAVTFMSGKFYPVNADALVKSRLLAFPNATFHELLSNSVDTCFRLMADMSQRLHRRLNEIDSLTLHNATYRLVSFLLAELPEGVVASQEIVLTTPKHVIASRLSIKPETFSRILTKLSRDGLIVVRGNSIVLEDLPRLRELVEI
ncbi:MAG: Crp/Fnr family transcriptional regulator [Thiohalobacteraceae bacterium]|nr:Crp/Fnr family transcriptional regulator [Gammaproteobacteria bacterium]